MLKRHFKKHTKAARYLIGIGDKVYQYRRDVLPQQQSEALLQAIRVVKEHLSAAASDKAAENLEKANERLDQKLKQCGGTLYPRSFLSENVEMLLVAAILVIGIRTFFLQPFKIPTNSMSPTYSGMTSEVFTPDHPRPGPIKGVLRTISLGATAYHLQAPAEGQLEIPIKILRNTHGILGTIACESFRGRKFGLLPTPRLRYTFHIGEHPVSLDVPQDFTLEQTLLKSLYPQYTNFGDLLADSYKNGYLRQYPSRGEWILATSKSFKKGQTILNFDLLTGDMLLVDRCSYHFRPPQIGDPIVFRTNEIPSIGTDKYYIKRLAGLGGDTVEIRAPMLYRNSQPIEGADAFIQNGQQTGEYSGYQNRGRLTRGRTDRIPDGYGYALGDNSASSSDSRMWGYLPEKALIGKAFFIYYPFSSRWGIAQ